jgi:phenylalanyl-tRNA synthetase beta chain
MINNLSEELDVLRPSMIETGLETISYNINRKNADLKFFEFGKTYHIKEVGSYSEYEHLALYLTGQQNEGSWKTKKDRVDFFRVKGIVTSLLQLSGSNEIWFENAENNSFDLLLNVFSDGKVIGTIGQLSNKKLTSFDIKQPVLYIDLNWVQLIAQVAGKKITYAEVAKFPFVQRDLALVVDKKITYKTLESSIKKLQLSKLKKMELFDIFESEKLGTDKKSVAISLTFLDDEKTLTDQETDSMMGSIVQTFEKELGAEIRR